MKTSMKKQFALFMAIVIPQFIIGSFVGEDRGTVDHWIYWPLVITVILGCLWFAGGGIYSMIKNKKKK